METLTAVFYSSSLELVLLIIAVVADIFLAIVVYLSNPTGATNRIFSLLALLTTGWLITNYFVRLPELLESSLAIHRMGIFFAAPMSTLFFLLAQTMPSNTIQLRPRYFYSVLAATIAMMLLNASPYAFTGITISDGVAHPITGLGLLPFSVLSTLFSILAVYMLIRKHGKSSGVEKKQISLVLMGILIMLALIIATVLIPVLILNSVQFLTLTPIYTLIFLGMTAYAITTYQLFDIKILVTQALTIVIWVVLFAKIFGEESRNAQFIDALVLVFTVIFGILLIRSVQKEVRQRQEIERLSQEKSEFMSFASHEIRNPLTAMKGYASLILEGDEGQISPGVRDAATKIMVTGNQVASLISQFLEKSKLELGQLRYNLADFDIVASVRIIADGLRPLAQQRGLTLTTNIDPNLRIMVHADENKVKEVVGNIIDNSIKYTRAGSVTVSVEKRDANVLISVADTGAGIAPEVLPHLFKKFSRADAQKLNLFGTGLGLYLSKMFVESQGGKIWAESEGKDKGSRFFIELPVI